jgi:ABC-2 type transport system ATP-binding protein
MIVEAQGLEKSFGATAVLRGLDLAVEQGTVLALLGPNGAGKSTTVRILSTLLRPDAGRARVAGHDVAQDPHKVRAVISLTGQNVALDELQTGEENMVMMGRLLHLDRLEARRRATELLERFDLMEGGRRLVKTYSGGMRRRLDLAISLIARPRVIFLDEPTTGLDPASRLAMWAAIRDLVAAGATVLLTTQYLEEADQLADRIAVIDGGRVIAQGTAEELKSAIAGERADLTFAGEDDFTRASHMLAGEAALIDQRRLIISVATDGSAAQVRCLLDRLADQRISVDKIALHKPSLDDVFLSLTREPAAAAALEVTR